MSLIIPGQNGGAMGQNPEVITTPTGIIYRFTQSTAPTSRLNAAGQNIGALVAGDLWYNPNTGDTAFRYGTRWLSTERLSLDYAAGTFITTSTSTIIDERLPPDAFVDGWSLSLDAAGTQDVSNNFTLSFGVAAGGGTNFISSSVVRSPYWNSYTDSDIIYNAGPADASIISNIPFTAFPAPTPSQSVQARATFVWTKLGVSSVYFGFNLWYRRILG